MNFTRVNRVFAGVGFHNYAKAYDIDFLKATFGDPSYQDGFGLYWSIKYQPRTLDPTEVETYDVTFTVSNVYISFGDETRDSNRHAHLFNAHRLFNHLDEASEAYEHHLSSIADDAANTYAEW